VIDGLIDILLPSVFVGSAGAISGLPNFAPVRFREPYIEKVQTDKALEDMRTLVGALPSANKRRCHPGSTKTAGCHRSCRQRPDLNWSQFVTMSTPFHVRTNRFPGWGYEANLALLVWIWQDA
jgi:hypothetical protein